jgi:hypothetical protein
MEGFIDTLNQELSQRAASKQPVEDRSLMPVIQISSLTRSGQRGAGEGKRSEAKRKAR